MRIKDILTIARSLLERLEPADVHAALVDNEDTHLHRRHTRPEFQRRRARFPGYRH